MISTITEWFFSFPANVIVITRAILFQLLNHRLNISSQRRIHRYLNAIPLELIVPKCVLKPFCHNFCRFFGVDSCGRGTRFSYCQHISYFLRHCFLCFVKEHPFLFIVKQSSPPTLKQQNHKLPTAAECNCFADGFTHEKFLHVQRLHTAGSIRYSSDSQPMHHTAITCLGAKKIYHFTVFVFVHQLICFFRVFRNKLHVLSE